MPSGRTRKGGRGARGLVGVLAAACGASLAVTVPASAQPSGDDEGTGQRTVLGGRASLAAAQLADGGWSVVTDRSDRAVLVAQGARVRVVVDAAVGPDAGAADSSSLVAELSDTAGLGLPRSVSGDAGILVVFDADTPAAAAVGQGAPPYATTSRCTSLPWTQAVTPRTTLTGEGDAKVVLGTPCTVERVYVVEGGAGNLLVEAQAPRGTDGGAASLAAMEALVTTLVPDDAHVGTHGPQHLQHR
ncbi:hypothetical protein BJF88_05400 [Cellulosimicrobium sp. CUA-896]|nr:hypothetical protein BJF88_05400 [Cellulosimicrobium sp. CUA-896]